MQRIRRSPEDKRLARLAEIATALGAEIENAAGRTIPTTITVVIHVTQGGISDARLRSETAQIIE
jgi:hypothetical protein